MLPLSAHARQIIMLEIAVGIEMETDQDRYDFRIGHHTLPAAFRCLGRRREGVFRHLHFKFFAKSSAIQKISVTLLSVIMIQYLLFGTSKLLNINDITKRIGNFFKLPIQLF